MNEDNLSKRINPEHCRTCGSCCKDFRLWYPMDNLALAEMVRLKYTTGLETAIKPVEGGIWLIINQPCRYLLEIDGVYSCLLYGQAERPLICRLYPYPGDRQEDGCAFIDQP